MEIKQLQNVFSSLWSKYRYVLLVVAVGIILMLLPTGDDSDQENSVPETVSMVREPSFSELLEKALCQIEGAGDVHVVLSVAAGEETIYQADSSINMNGDTGSTVYDTIIVTNSQRDQTGLVRQVNPQTYLGAVVVCHGADDPSVKLAIIDAVAKVTGLGTDRISVLKMK